MSNANGNDKPPVGQEEINTDIITLTRFLTEEQTKHKEATGDFTYVLLTTSTYCPRTAQRQLTHPT